MNKSNLDGLILITTLISNYVSKEELNSFCNHFGDLPLVSIGVEIPDRPSILIDNRKGLERIVEHLITDHKAEKIAFIRGPQANWEANERFSAYKSVLQKHNIPFDERLIGQGDFTQFNVDSVMSPLLQKNPDCPDAFVFANDEMAIAGLHWLQQNGIKVPGTAAVTGFDDIDRALSQNPMLTTVSQPFRDMGMTAVEMTVDILDGRKVDPVVYLPAEAVIRTSCGCMLPCVKEMQRIDEMQHTLQLESPDKIISWVQSMLDSQKYTEHVKQQFRDENIEKFIMDLNTVCRVDIPEKEYSRLSKGILELFSELLNEEIHKGMNPHDWQIIIPIVQDGFLHLCKNTTDLNYLRHVTRTCLMVSAELSEQVLNLQSMNLQKINNLLRDVQYNLSSIFFMGDLTECLQKNLPMLGINTFYLCVYDKEWNHERNSVWASSEKMRFITGLQDGKSLTRRNNDTQLFQTEKLLSECLKNDTKRRSLALFPLFFREMHYGVIVYELVDWNGFVYETLSTQISGILRAVMLYQAKERAQQELRRALTELETFNEELSHLSLTDDLTGLYNRRGFIKLTQQQMQLSRQMKKPALIIYGDMDGLKKINDCYGHDEGDWAIKMTGDILRKTFRNMDIIARLGGDEFTVFASNTTKDIMPVFKSRLNTLCKEVNTSSGKPYCISISVGFVSCSPESNITINEYLKKADEELYIQKRNKNHKVSDTENSLFPEEQD